MRWFGPKLPIDVDELDWQFACFKWMLTEFEGIARHRQTRLVTPTVDFFPGSREAGHDRALELFGQVRDHAGLANTRFTLMADAADRPAFTAPGVLHSRGGTLGTYRVEDRGGGFYETVITYNPSLIGQPMRMVSTFAHELAHYVIDGARSLSPGGHDLHELATDLTAVFLGFGIFMANGAKTFSAYQDPGGSGWSSSRSGYVSEAGLVTAMAISERLADRDPMMATQWLKPHLASDLKKAARYLDRHHPDILADVMAIDLADYRVN